MHGSFMFIYYPHVIYEKSQFINSLPIFNNLLLVDKYKSYS
jgi:hypothetical protein